MTAPIAKTKASMLIDSLNEMMGVGIDVARLIDIEAEANKLKAYGMYADACNVLGMVSSLRMDINRVDKYFKAAISHTGRDIETLVNYAVALNNAYQSKRAIETIDDALESAQGDGEVIRKAINIHIAGFDAAGVRSLLKRWPQSNECTNTTQLDLLEKYEAAFSAVGASWEYVADRISIAASAVSSAVNRPTAEFDIYEGVVLCRFVVDASIEDAVRAESAMIDSIANQPFNPADRAIYFSCATA